MVCTVYTTLLAFNTELPNMIGDAPIHFEGMVEKIQMSWRHFSEAEISENFYMSDYAQSTAVENFLNSLIII